MTAPFDVVDFEDCTAQAAELGFRCTIAIARRLLDEVSATDALARLHAVIEATAADPAMHVIRARALQNELMKLRPATLADASTQHFVQRCRAGIGGVSDGGSVVALPIVGKSGLVMMICQLGYYGAAQPDRGPAITLTTIDTASFYLEPMAVRRASP